MIALDDMIAEHDQPEAPVWNAGQALVSATVYGWFTARRQKGVTPDTCVVG